MEQFKFEPHELTSKELKLLNEYLYAEFIEMTDDTTIKELLKRRKKLSKKESIDKNLEDDWFCTTASSSIGSSKFTVISVNSYSLQKYHSNEIRLDFSLRWFYVMYDQRYIKRVDGDEWRIKDIERELSGDDWLTYNLITDYLKILNYFYLSDTSDAIPSNIVNGISIKKKALQKFVMKNKVLLKGK